MKTQKTTKDQHTRRPLDRLVRRFYWKQSYEIGNRVHWALHDTKTDEERPRMSRVTCPYMVLYAAYPVAINGKPVSEQYWPKLIAELLTAHFSANDRAERRRR